MYAFTAAKSTEHPNVEVLFSTNEKVAGLTTYYGLHGEYLLVIFPGLINIYDRSYKLVNQIEIAGVDDYELNDAAIYQGVIGPKFPSAAIAYAIESDEFTGFSISSLEKLFSNPDHKSTFAPNTAFTPRDFVCGSCTARTCESLSNCSGSGFCPSKWFTRSMRRKKMERMGMILRPGYRLPALLTLTFMFTFHVTCPSSISHFSYLSVT